MKKLDLVNKRFGSLIVIKEHCVRNNGHIMWECLCDCGKTSIVKGIHLKSEHTKSCGCAQSAMMKKISKTRSKTHGFSKTDLYHVWASMKSRCYYPKNVSYPYYGLRGIVVCNEWKKFENFYSWAINNGYKKGLSIDRINNDGNYQPNNCRWATLKEQANNMSTNIKLSYNGKTKTVIQWCEIFNIKKDTAYRKLRRGKSFEEIFIK